MTSRLSRRRVLAVAGAMSVGTFLGASLGGRRVVGQPSIPEEALARLLSADQLDPSWFSPALLSQVPLQQLQQAIAGLGGLFGNFESVTAEGAGQYVAHFSGGDVQLRAAFDDQLRLTAFTITGLNYALAPDEQEISFTNGNETLYGTLLIPEGVTAPPAALLIAGSGPTDRNGNSPLLGIQVNTLAALARALAAAGVASLRYDKLGAGKTGRAGRGPTDFPTVGTFLDEALAAYAALLARPEVDPTRTLIAGHSEGGLYAELLAQQQTPSALLLAAPLAARFLDTLRRQLVAQADGAQAAGQISQERHDRLIADLDATIASIRAYGVAPKDVFADVPEVLALFGPSVAAYEQEEDRYDPAEIAAQLPPALPVLVLRGALDVNVVDAEIQHLAGGFRAAGNMAVQVQEFPNVDHELRQIPPGRPPSLTVFYPFSPAVADAVRAFAMMAVH